MWTTEAEKNTPTNKHPQQRSSPVICVYVAQHTEQQGMLTFLLMILFLLQPPVWQPSASTKLLATRPVPCQHLGHRPSLSITVLSQAGQERWKRTQRIFKFSLAEAYNFCLGLEVFLVVIMVSVWGQGRGNELSCPKRTSFFAVLCVEQRCWEQNMCLMLDRHPGKQA